MAMGTVLTNKYAEGYSGKRYYGGCEYVDVVETIAIERAKKLFGCDYANVQPHSGAQANMAVFIAMLKPGDTVMGMSLDSWRTSDTRKPCELLRNIFLTLFRMESMTMAVIDYDEVEKHRDGEQAEADHRRSQRLCQRPLISSGSVRSPTRWVLT